MTRSDAGKVEPPQDEGAKPDEAARLRDVLVTAIPTELVAPYTFLVTLLIGFIDVEKGEHLDQFRTLRWALYIVLVFATVFFAWSAVRAKRSGKNWKPVPALEVASATVASAVWGLTVPESPLVLELNGDNRIIVPTLILVVGGVVYGVLSNGLTATRRGS